MAIGAVSRVTAKPGVHAIEDLFGHHHELLYRTAYSILNHAADAEDVVQSVFLRLVRREGLPATGTNVAGYLYRAAVNQSLDILRSRRRYELVANVEDLEIASGPEASRFSEQMHRRLEVALTALSPDAVHLLVLRYTHNYSDRQIATLLGMSRAAVAVRLFRSRARLKKLMRLGEER